MKLSNVISMLIYCNLALLKMQASQTWQSSTFDMSSSTVSTSAAAISILKGFTEVSWKTLQSKLQLLTMDYSTVSHRLVLCHNLLLIIVFLSLDQIKNPLGDNVAARFRHGVVLGYEVLQRRDGALQVGNFHGGICLVVDLGLLDFDVDFFSSARNCYFEV